MTKQITQSLGGITLVVIVAAAALLLFASSAFAAGTLGGDTTTVAAGGAATVTITGQATSGTNGIGNWTVDITVDSAKLGTAACGATVNPAGDCNVISGNVVRLFGATTSDTGLTGSQVLGTINVTAQSALAAGTCSDLTMTITKFQDGAGADLSPTITNGKVCVAAAATASPTAAPTATAAPPLPKTGGNPGDSSSMLLTWLLVAAGLVVVSGGAWAVSRARREI